MMGVRVRWAAGLSLAMGCGGPEQSVATDRGSSSSGGREDDASSNGDPSAPNESSGGVMDSTSTAQTTGDEGSTQSSSGTSVDSGDTTSSSSQSSAETSGTSEGEATTTGSTSPTATSTSDGESSTTGGADPCGNGLLDDGEACDDGNEIGGDGCEADCTSSDDVEPLWELELGGPTGYVDCGTGVAFDSEGNLILGAYTEPDVIWIRKYDVDYVEQWTVTYPGQPGGSCPRTRVAIDADDNIGFVGGVADGDPSISGMFFGMLDADGNELWAMDHEEPGTTGEIAGDVAFDPDGNLLLVGAIGLEGSTYADLYVAKYDSLGGFVWSDIYDGMVSGSDFASGVDVDLEGNVMVSGNTRGAGNDHDIFVRKYDTDGVEQWTDIVAGPDAGMAYDFGYGIATNADEAVVAGVFKPAGESHQIWSRRYTAAGMPSWTSLHEEAGLNDRANAVDWSADFGIVVAGIVVQVGFLPVAWLRKLDGDGTTVWTRHGQLSDTWSDVAIAPDGRIAVAGSVQLAFPFDYEAHFAVYPP